VLLFGIKVLKTSNRFRQLIFHSEIADKMADFLVIFMVLLDNLTFVMTLWLENELKGTS
jgi:hypothetical protein